MRIGLYGGSFNPVHNGHLMLATYAKHELNLDKIFFIPSNVTPGKNNLIDGRIRHDMIFKTLISTNHLGFVSDYEINKNGISYSIDTVRFFKNLYPNDELFLICGSDIKDTIKEWKDYKQLKKLIDIKIANRDFYCPDIPIRSTQIRKLLKNKKPITYLVPKSVETFIKCKKLYED